MPEHKADTNKVKQIKLTSSLEHVVWTDRMAAPTGKVSVEIITQFVGGGASLEVAISDHSGKKFETIKTKMSGNKCLISVIVPPKAEKALYADVKFPKHSLSGRSNALLLVPPIELKNLKWSAEEARRGDTLTPSADIVGDATGFVAEISIFEHDADGAHDLITTLTSLVTGSKIEAEWEFEYHDDTDDIPTEDEAEKGYSRPEYFFRVRLLGIEADSGLLLFKDWIEIELKDDENNFIPDEEFELKLADGSEKKGKLDDKGIAKEEDIPPGPVEIKFSNFDMLNKVVDGEIKSTANEGSIDSSSGDKHNLTVDAFPFSI